MKNIAELFLVKTSEFKEGIAFAEPESGCFDHPYGRVEEGYVYYSYSELRDMALKTAQHLESKGYSRGSRIALLAQNSVYWPVVYFAIQLIGATAVPLDTHLSGRDNIHLLRHSGAQVLFASCNAYDKIDTDLAKGLSLKEVILLDGGYHTGPELLSNILKYRQLSSEKLSAPGVIRNEDTALLLYTSGTTAEPKGVCLTHGNLIHQAKAIPAAVPYTREDVFLAMLPLFHSFSATSCLLTPLVAGCKVVFPRTFKSKILLNVIKSQRVTAVIGSPFLYRLLLRALKNQLGVAILG